MKKKVLLISSSMDVGGIERGFIGLLENLNLDKYDVDLFLWQHQGEWLCHIPKGINLLPEEPAIAALGTSLNQLLKEKQYVFALIRILSKASGWLYATLRSKRQNSGYYYMLFLMRLLTRLRGQFEKEYDCVISFRPSHEIGAYYIKAKKKIAGIRVDYSADFIDADLEHGIWKEYDYIFAVSQQAAEQFCLKFPKLSNKIFVFENLISPERVWEEAQNDINKEIPDEPGVTKLCTVARFSYAKGIDNAVLIHKKLLESALNFKWYVIGYGPDEEKIRNLVEQHKVQDTFILLGKKENPYPYMLACDIYVQPSRSEGKANAVKEAQMLHKPVAITNYTTATSQLIHREDGVILSSDVEKTANELAAFILDKELQEKIVNNCKTKDFNKNSNMKIIEEIIDGS